MNAPYVRGACPGLSAPMLTGDGLLVRLTLRESIAPQALVALCAAAGQHGNGVLQITARGNLQVRGLSPRSAPLFAAEVADLEIADECPVPVVSDPLRHDPCALIDTVALVAALRQAIGDAQLTLAPKVSVAIDGGSRLHLDALSADLRLRAFMTGPTPHLQIAVGGDARSATPLGGVTLDDAPAAVVRLLAVIAARGRTARAADVLHQEGIAPFRSAAADELKAAPVLPERQVIEAIGQHRLRGGRIALGVAPAFGQTDAAALAQLARCAREHGTRWVQPAPGRVLLLNGLDQANATALAMAAEHLTFIVRADDPRRRIAACPGKPACASGWIAARALASEVAQQLPRRFQGVDIHISGCAKGCAHPRLCYLDGGRD